MIVPQAANYAKNLSSSMPVDKIFSKKQWIKIIGVPTAFVLNFSEQWSDCPKTDISVPREGAILADNDPRMAATRSCVTRIAFRLGLA